VSDGIEILAILRGDNKLSQPTDQARESVERLVRAGHEGSRSLSGLGDAFGSVAKQAAGFAVAIVAVDAARAAIDRLRGAVDAGFKFNNLQQQSLLAFETMMGSSDAAKQHLQDLTAFAAQTPFELPGVIDASQKLQAMGFQSQQIIPMLGSIGDAMAGLGKGDEGINRVVMALGQMQAKGTASAEELMQITELGVPAWEGLAKQIGVSVPEAMDLVSRGAVRSGDAIAGVLNLMDERFNGLMEKQSRTFGGLASTLRDTFNQAMGTVIEPFFDRATEQMQRLTDAANRPEFQAALQGMARGFDDLLTRMAPVADFLESQVLPKLGGIGEAFGSVFGASNLKDSLDAIDKTVAQWAEAFVDWVPGAAEALGKKVEEIWGVLGPWVEEKAKLLAQKFLEQWLPATVDWIVDQALPWAITKFTEFAGGILQWVEDKGAAMMFAAGAKLKDALLRGMASGIGAGASAAGTWVDDQFNGTRVSQEERALGYANYDPTVTSGGVTLRQSEIQANVAAFNAAWAEYSANTFPETVSEVIAEATTAAGPAAREGGTYTGNQFGGATRAPAVAGAKGAGLAAGEAMQESAIEGFMRAASAETRFAAIFGEWGGKGANALETAMRENSGAAGAALRTWVQDATTKMREAGITDFQDVADALAGAFHDALIERGNPAARAAAMEMIRTVTEAIKAANALTPESFAKAFDAAQLSASFGSGGASIMDALNRAWEEGGQQNIATLARSVQSMQATLLQNPDLSPERASQLAGELMDAFRTMITDKTPETRAAFESMLQNLNLELPLEIARQKMEETINVAIQRTEETITNARQRAEQEVDQLWADFRRNEERQGQRDALQQGSKGETDAENTRYQQERQRVQDTRETRDLERDINRYVEDTTEKRAKELADLQASMRKRAESAGKDANLGQGMGKARSEVDDEMQKLKDRWAAEDAQRAKQQQRATDDRTQRKADQTADLNAAEEHRRALEGIADRLKASARDLEKSFTNEDLLRRQQDILDRAADVEKNANAALAETERVAKLEYGKLEGRMELIRDTLLPQIKDVADSTYDGMVEDLQKAVSLAASLHGVNSGGGTTGGGTTTGGPSGSLSSGNSATLELSPASIHALAAALAANPMVAVIDQHHLENGMVAGQMNLAARGARAWR